MTPKEIADRALVILTDLSIEEWGTSHGEHDIHVSWEGDRSEGWRVLSEMMSAALPVTALRRAWRVVDGEITGPRWEIELTAGSLR